MIVTEGILDSMAIMTILDQKGLDFKCYDYLSLIGTNKTECVATILEEQSHIKTVILSLDNDDAGRKATEVTIDMLNTKFPEIKYRVNMSKKYKDFNDVLMARACFKKAV